MCPVAPELPTGGWLASLTVGFRVSGLACESQGWLPSLTVGFRVSGLASESQGWLPSLTVDLRVSGLASESQGWLPSLTVGLRVSWLASESQSWLPSLTPLLPGATPGSSAPRRLQLRGAELRGAERGAPLQLRSWEAPLLGTYRMSPVPSPRLLAEG